MGAVTAELDIRLIECLSEVMKLDTFIETGTFRGDTVAAMMQYFKHIISIELSPVLYDRACRRFSDQHEIKLYCGESSDLLSQICSSVSDKSVLYWLDAHWCNESDTAGRDYQCPLLDEIRAIGSLNDQSLLLIDDARLFLSTPAPPHDSNQWPDLGGILIELNNLSAQHRLAIINDVLLFYPEQASDAIQNYALNFGIDWLEAVQALSGEKLQYRQIEEKSKTIQELKQVLAESELAQQKKEIVIKEQARALLAFRSILFVLRPFIPLFRLVRGGAAQFYPKLGNLNQYPPQPLIHNTLDIKIIPTKNLPTISVVTPSFRHGHFIERTIKSVLDQAYPVLEYVVQDGWSNDGTVEILSQYAEQLLGFESRTDRGQSHAINLGFARTNGEIMGWLNSDDLYLPGTLQIVGNYFAHHPEVDVVYGNRILIDEDDQEIGRWILPSHQNGILSWADYVPQESLFWRRSIWESVGGYVDEDYSFAMDWELLLRFREAGARMVRLPYYLGAFRIHEQQKTSAAITDTGFAEMERLRKKIHGRDVTSVEIKKAVAPYLVRHMFHHTRHMIVEKVSSVTGRNGVNSGINKIDVR